MRLKPLREPSIVLKNSKKHRTVLEIQASPQFTSHSNRISPPSPPGREREEEEEEQDEPRRRRQALTSEKRGEW
jgi:hypothetical protein